MLAIHNGCTSCSHGEMCRDNHEDIHCNLHDKSFDRYHSCEYWNKEVDISEDGFIEIKEKKTALNES